MTDDCARVRLPAAWLAGALFVLAEVAAATDALVLPAADFDPPVTARLAAHTSLRALVAAVDESEGRVLRIRHGGGEVPARRAEGLRDGLVALGLPSARLELMPAAAGADEIILEIVSGDKGR